MAVNVFKRSFRFLILTESNMFFNLLFGPCRLIWLLSKVGHLSKRETHFLCIFPETLQALVHCCLFSFSSVWVGKATAARQKKKENAYGRPFLQLKDVASFLGKKPPGLGGFLSKNETARCCITPKTNSDGSRLALINKRCTITANISKLLSLVLLKVLRPS